VTVPRRAGPDTSQKRRAVSQLLTGLWAFWALWTSETILRIGRFVGADVGGPTSMVRFRDRAARMDVEDLRCLGHGGGFAVMGDSSTSCRRPDDAAQPELAAREDEQQRARDAMWAGVGTSC